VPEPKEESRRPANGGPAQRQVFCLGEITDSREAAWRITVSVFDKDTGQSRQFALFPAGRTIPADEANALALAVTDGRLLRSRSFGDCWLGCPLWEELGLSAFWQAKLSEERGAGVAAAREPRLPETRSRQVRGRPRQCLGHTRRPEAARTSHRSRCRDWRR
jgi:hypothetical protein